MKAIYESIFTIIDIFFFFFVDSSVLLPKYTINVRLWKDKRLTFLS